MKTNRVLIGDCRKTLKELPDACVHMVLTSPPYFGLRDYGTGKWEGGDPDCDHSAGRGTNVKQTKCYSAKGAEYPAGAAHRGGNPHQCAKCGARRVDRQIGLEQTPAEYVARMVKVFRALRRVLRDDGCVFLNVGDTYASNCATVRKRGRHTIGQASPQADERFVRLGGGLLRTRTAWASRTGSSSPCKRTGGTGATKSSGVLPVTPKSTHARKRATCA